jgi:hypothetical protein
MAQWMQGIFIAYLVVLVIVVVARLAGATKGENA